MTDDRFLVLLKQHSVDAIIDVRLHNEGRWYRFASGKHIEGLLQAQRIAYIHETRLSPTNGMLQHWRKHQDWPFYGAAFRTLLVERNMALIWPQVAAPFSRPCLLCAEKSAKFCHRRLLADHIGETFGVPVIHIQ